MNRGNVTVRELTQKPLNLCIFSFQCPKPYYESGKCYHSKIITKPLKSLGILNRMSKTLI